MPRSTNPIINKNHRFFDDLVWGNVGHGFSTNVCRNISPKPIDGPITGGDPGNWQWANRLNRPCLWFDGTDDQMVTPSLGFTNLAYPYTLSLWFRPLFTSWSVYCFGMGSGGYPQLQALWVPATNQIRFYVPDAFIWTGANTIYNEVWHHICIEITSVTTGSMYLNGNYLMAMNGSSSRNQAMSVQYGRSTSGYGKCQIADGLLHRRVLSPVEIKQLADPSNVMLSGFLRSPQRRAFSVAAPSGRVGDIAQTLPRITQVSAASVAVAGDIAQTLPRVTQVAAASVAVAGDIAQTLPRITQVSAASVAVAGDIAQTLPGITQVSAASAAFGSDVAQTLPGITQAAGASVAVAGDAAQTLPGITQASVASVAVASDIVQTLPRITQVAAVSTQTPGTADIAQTLPGITQASGASVAVAGDIAQTLPRVTQVAAVSGQLPGTGSITQTLSRISQVADTGTSRAMDGVQTLPRLSQAIDSAVAVAGDISQTLPRITQVAVAHSGAPRAADIAQTLPRITQVAGVEPEQARKIFYAAAQSRSFSASSSRSFSAKK